MPTDDQLIADQIAYYRARAAQYDQELYLDAHEQWRVDDVVAQVDPTGDVLELACGTGVWTQRLARRARSLTCVDASAEMVAIARARVGPAVSFVTADLFAWQPGRRYNLVFFAFWLSHVPAARFGPFWTMLRAAVTDGRRVAFVDQHVDAQDSETWLSDDVAQRRLRDGSVHPVVKWYLDPPALADRLAELGWRAEVERVAPGWVLGTARPAWETGGHPSQRGDLHE